jgi:multidrug efflux system membrane fusion protein
LTAPIDGVTGIRQVDEGNVIHPTDVNGLVDLTRSTHLADLLASADRLRADPAADG